MHQEYKYIITFQEDANERIVMLFKNQIVAPIMPQSHKTLDK